MKRGSTTQRGQPGRPGHPQPPAPPFSLREKIGVCQWFHYEDRAQVERVARAMHELNLKHLRTGISWADFYRRGGKRWYDWQMNALSDFDVLLSVWHTPPSIAQGGVCNGPPKRLRDYADFIDHRITEYDGLFTHLELWNEPNNRLKWDFARFDPEWRQFGEMIADAAHWARVRGTETVLGGMIPVDPHWLRLMKRHGVLDHIDVVAIHGFPGMWWDGGRNWDWHAHWNGWENKVESLRPVAPEMPIWITETGLATWDLAQSREAKFDLQVRMLRDAADAPAERVYWYCLFDLDPAREAIEGFHVDENEYHLGLLTHDGRKKPAWHAMRQLMCDELTAARSVASPGRASPRRA